MEKNQADNTVHEFGLLKKVLLFLNVSTFRVIRQIPSVSDFRQNYKSEGLSVAIIVFAEITIFEHLFPGIDVIYINRFAVICFIYNGIIDVFFSKDILRMAYNYNAYYNKILFYIYLVFFAIGLMGAVVLFNNEIGHVRPTKSIV